MACLQLGDGRSERNARQRARAQRRADVLAETKAEMEARREALQATIGHKEESAKELERKRMEELEQKRAVRTFLRL